MKLQRLPDKYRGLVVLCYLQGKTNAEVADQLHWPVGTVKSRLNRARELLRKRLARRGVVLTAGLLAAHALTAPAPAALVEGTFRAALLFAVGDAAVGGAASAGALALTKGVLQTMFLSKLKLVAAAVLSVAVVLGAGGLAYYGLAVDAPATDDKPKEDKDAIQGNWKVTAIEENGKDSDEREAQRIKEATVTITADKIVFNTDGNVLELAYGLDPASKPKAIDLDNLKLKSWKGVYSLNGNTLKICWPIQEGDDRPSEVGAKEGSNTRLLTLKREAKDK
jgi:uncharacterized protein (TIGR03067 family)